MEGVGFAQRKAWLLVLLLILIGQGWLTVRFLGAENDLSRLVNDEPIVAGKHPLHLYHGWLGAKTWIERGTSACYDPAYQAGYPKTPVFDSGSRMAELFLLVAGGDSLAAYKIGLALGCLMIPALFCLFARGLNLTAGPSCLAALLGSVLWWASPIRTLLEIGEFDLLIGTLCLLIHLGWWVRFSVDPWLDSWFVLTITSIIGWYAQPLLMIAFVPLIFLVYCWVGYRHGVAWHLSILAMQIFTVVVNFPWLSDWVRYALPLLSANEVLPAQTIPWKALLYNWHELFPRDPLSVGVGTLGFIGLLGLLRPSGSPGVILFLAMSCLLTIGAAGKCWQPMFDLGARKVLPLAVWAMVPGCAFLLTFAADRFGRSMELRLVGGLWLLVVLIGLGWAMDLPTQLLDRKPLQVGFSEDQKQIVALLKVPESVNDDAISTGRVLWEDREGESNRWTPLLRLYTGRDFIGALDPEGSIEHSRIRLQEGRLREKPISDWKDEELKTYLTRYNIRWIVAGNPASVRRFSNCPLVKQIARKSSGEDTLFEVERASTLFLRGTGKVVQLDWQRIALADLMPQEDGEIILSLHYQQGWRIAPPYVEMEKAVVDPFDPIPMIRLKLPGPLARVTLVWENR
jgi:hypothetical protein